MSDGPDMEQRDVNSLNSHVKVMFDEVLAEPEGVRSADCVWRNSYKCFNCSLDLCYTILTYICGVPMAICWGCEFACTACYHIWYLTPCMKALELNCGCINKLMNMCFNTCCTPFMQSCGQCFSQIVVTNK